MVSKKLTLSQCSVMVDGECHGDPQLIIRGVGDVHTASSEEISFVTKADMLAQAEKSEAAALVLPRNLAPSKKPCILSDNPVLSITRLHQYFLRQEFEAKGIHPSAVLGENCSLSEKVTIGAHCVLGDRVKLGDRVRLHPGVVLGDDVCLGDDCELFPSVTVYANCLLGDRVIVHAGSVIGSDGYGYVPDQDGHHLKRPHVGKVILESDVEIGANVCVDRGTFGETRVRRGAKIDNLVQIAHNVEIGEDNLIVALVGIAGSTKLGRHVVVGGNAGIVGHVRLEDNVIVAAKAGVHGNAQSGTVLAGYPAVPREKWLRINAITNRLPEMYNTMKKLKKDVAFLQELIGEKERGQE